MNKLIYAILAAAAIVVSCSKTTEGMRWSEEKAAAWASEKGWVSGCNFIPSNSINQLEMWQAEYFDEKTIDRELGWAQDLGFNCMRVFLHHLAWEADKDGFKDRIDRYLEISSSHGISTMLVFLDDCWSETAALGKQPEPVRGSHNSGWLKDPGALYYGLSGSGHDYAQDTVGISRLLESYVKDVMSTFKNDDRIYAWDLYNEPGGGQDPHRYYERSFPLLKNVFKWAREVNPSQPITAGIWSPLLSEMNYWQIMNSDIISYHTYEGPDQHRHVIDTLRKYNRPMVCTEYMARTQDSMFQNIMPILKENGVGAINWGLVSGKTNTIFSWETINSPADEDEPELWFHDILRKDGSPYDESETECIKTLTGAK